MKRLLSILLFIPIIGISQYTAIPDQYFEQALIDLGHDDILDGQVLTANISEVELLDVSGNWSQSSNISDLTGIESFMALTELDCSINQLTSLDVSQNTALTSLNCSDNQLTSLELNSLLQNLECAYNPLTSLDLTQNTALTSLDFYGSQLTSIDVSQNTALTYLMCQKNQLKSLDLSNNTALTWLDCNNNQLTSLDLSQNIALITSRCAGNQLTCLNLKNGNNENNDMYLYAAYNTLICIEVDNTFWATQNWTTEEFNIDEGVTFSTNCNYPAGCFTNRIEEYHSNLSIYPNPTNNLIKIEIENYNGSFEAELYDFTGKLLETTNSTSLSLADYPTGIYLLKVAYGDRFEQLKVVKE